MVTLQALFIMYQEAFFQQDPNSYHCLEQLAKQLDDVCINGSKAQVEEVHAKVVQTTELMQITEMAVFDARQDKIPLFKVMHQYMRMVKEQFEPETGHFI